MTSSPLTGTDGAPILRTALVHDSLTGRGRPERVLLHLAEALPDPVIITSAYDPEGTFPEFSRFPVHAMDGHARDKGPGRAADRAHTLTSAAAFRSLDLTRADLVVVSTTGAAHHVRHPRKAVYWHDPPESEREHDGPPGAGPGRPPAVAAHLRRSEREAALAPAVHATSSHRAAQRLRDGYGIEPEVLHPPLDTARLGPSLVEPAWPPRCLVVSRLVPQERVDVAIAACREVGIPLTVIGEGPDQRRLREMADESVTFVSSVSDPELAAAYRSHSVVLCPDQGHSGLEPLEAGYVGRPVVASSAGGAMETVLHRETGWLVGGWDPLDWAMGLTAVLQRRWDLRALRSFAERFGTASFDAGLARWLGAAVARDEALRLERDPLRDFADQGLLAS